MRRQPHTSPSPHTSQRYEKASEKYQVYLDISYCERKYLRVHLKDCNQKGRKHIKEKGSEITFRTFVHPQGLEPWTH